MKGHKRLVKLLQRKARTDSTDYNSWSKLIIKSLYHKTIEYLGIDEADVNIESGIDDDQRKYLKIARESNTSKPEYLVIRHFNEEVLKQGEDLYFTRCIFDCSVSFLGTITNQLHFEQCKFQKGVHFCGVTFQHKIRFYDTIFQKKANFSLSKFQADVFFLESVFEEEADFSYSTFANNARFSRSIFKDEANFSYSTFKRETYFPCVLFQNQALFGSVHFKDIIYFFKARFEKGIDLVNSQLELSFDALRSKIESESENAKSKRANEYRDTFRLLKQSLIKDGNHLDASSYHRAELYCKEIELKHSTKEKLHREREELEIQKGEIPQEKKLALLRVSTKLAIVRAKIKLPIITTTTELRNSIDRIQLWFYRHTSDHHTDLLRIINSIMILIGYFVLFMYVANVGDCNRFAVSIQKYLSLDILESPIQILFSLMAVWLIVSLVFAPYKFMVIIGYIFTLILIYNDPAYIFSFTNLFSNKTCINGVQNIVIVIYSILFAILLFSLQKTARKNSIIPT